jgi:hypothetical protein
VVDPKKELSQPSAAAGTDHDQVGARFRCDAENLGRRLADGDAELERLRTVAGVDQCFSAEPAQFELGVGGQRRADAGMGRRRGEQRVFDGDDDQGGAEVVRDGRGIEQGGP